MKILNKIDVLYSDTTIQKRFIAKSMFWISLTVTPIFIYGFVINFIEADYFTALIEGAFALFLLSGIPLIFRKKIDLVSLLFIYFALIVGFSIGVVSTEPSQYASFIAFVFLVPTLAAMALMGHSVKQSIISGVLAQAGIVLTYFLKVLPAIERDGGAVEAASMLIMAPVLMMGIVNVLLSLVVYSNKSIIDKLSESESESNERILNMTSFFASLKETINIGEDLNSSAEHSLSLSGTIGNNLKAMEASVENLKSQIESTQNIHESINRAGRIVMEGTQTQSSAVEQSASAVEEMASSIVQMSKTAESRRELIEELVETEKEVAGQIKTGQKSFEKVKASAGEMLNIVSVISDIAERTNLLAMNAAIEAAHAGSTGRGFAVVAQEIKKLAEEAGANSQKITDIIQGSIKGIDHAVELNSRVGNEFHVVSEKVQEIDGALSEIINGFSELASGTTEITHAVENLTVINSSVQSSVNDVTGELSKGRDSVDQISSATEGIIKNMNDIAGDSRSIREEAEKLYTIGQDNVKHIRLLEEKLT